MDQGIRSTFEGPFSAFVDYASFDFQQLFLPISPDVTLFRVVPFYDQQLSNVWVNREVHFELCRYGRVATGSAVLSEMKSLGYRPALLQEGLAFSARFPHEQRKSRIALLGSEAEWSVPYLWNMGRRISLHLAPLTMQFNQDDRFLVVRL